MTNKIAIVTDSTSDIPEKAQKELNIHVVEAYVHFGDETFTSANLTLDEFHDKLQQASKENFPKTSQPSGQDFLEKFEELKEQGTETILCVLIGSELAGTINSAKNASDMIEGIDVILVDSHTTSAPLYVCLQYTRKLVDKGKDPMEIKKIIENFGPKLVGYFSLKTMDNLVRGGRMGRVRYGFGRLLNIKPILKLDDGKIESYEKARGLDNSRNRVYELATEGYSSSDEFRYIIAHCQTPEYANEFEKKLNNEFTKAEGETIQIGMAVSVHTGPGSIYLLTYRFPEN